MHCIYQILIKVKLFDIVLCLIDILKDFFAVNYMDINHVASDLLIYCN